MPSYFGNKTKKKFKNVSKIRETLKTVKASKARNKMTARKNMR